jgi:hypothetical protein
MSDIQKHNFRLVRSRVKHLTRAERLEYYQSIRLGPFHVAAVIAASMAVQA